MPSRAARVQAALDELLRTHQSGDVALIAHGGVCRTIIGSILGMPMHKWLCLAQAYACLNVIDWYEGRPVLMLLNSKNSAYGRPKSNRAEVTSR